MTEDEAKQKICPKFLEATTIASHIAINGGATQQDLKELVEMNKCVASGCMMYRTYGVTEEIDGGKYTTQHGYCGLAGKP